MACFPYRSSIERERVQMGLALLASRVLFIASMMVAFAVAVMWWLSWYTSLPVVVKSAGMQGCLYVEEFLSDGSVARHECGWEEGRKFSERWVR